MSETRTSGAISTMRLPELKELAQSLGIEVDPKARKADLVAQIRAVRGPSKPGRPRRAAVLEDASAPVSFAAATERRASAASVPGTASENSSVNDETPAPGQVAASFAAARAERAAQRAAAARRARNSSGSDNLADATANILEDLPQRPSHPLRSSRPRSIDDIVLPEKSDDESEKSERSRRPRVEVARRDRRPRDRRPENQMSEEDKRAALEAISAAAEQRKVNADEDSTNRRRPRRERGRRDNFQDTRTEPRRGEENESRSEDDVLIPVAGILDFEGNQAFLRTGGYLPGVNDASVAMQMVKQYGLRRGDAIVGAVRQRGEFEGARGRNQHRKFNHQKLNSLVQIDTINSLEPERSAQRPEFQKLTPLYPQETLRLETGAKALTARAIDLVAPIGKGQRGLIVSPPKAGKTMVMQQIAMAIANNYPQVHLMVVLVDERPEEVTDMKRLVKGEVIASTFDRPASDHTIVAELAIERAKRLVELGQDVVVLLDSLTRLSRAYNLAAPASGRILSGGVDAAALYPPKKFFGAARNIEHGGSLTIIASALVETGSKMDEVIFEEFKGTGNMELRLSRQLADRRLFPAIDVNASGTRREEMLFTKDELKVIWQLRRALGTLDVPEAADFLLGRMRKTESNAEFLVSILRQMQQ